MPKKRPNNSTNTPHVSVWKRLIIPLALVFVWLGLAGVGGPYFGKIEQVSSNDLSTFLPASAESTEVNNALAEFQDRTTIPLLIVFGEEAQLTEEQTSTVDAAMADIESSGVAAGTISPPILSEDGIAKLAIVPLSSEGEPDELISEVTEVLEAQDGLPAYELTGPAMFSKDLAEAFAGIDGTLLIVALSVVLVILLVVYRSPFLPIITLLGALSALAVSILAVWHLADNDIVLLNGQVQGILFILVIGAATDYSLLYIARYREELIRQPTAWQATRAAWKASVEPIAAAGGTVTIGLLCLLASDLGSNQALGPVGAIGISFAVLVALTYLPAILLLFGKRAYWPKMPVHETRKSVNIAEKNHPLWAKVARFVGTHPRRVWAGVAAVLIIASAAAPQFEATGVEQTDFVLGQSDARDGQQKLEQHFARGSGAPMYVLVSETDIDRVVDFLDEAAGIEGVAVLTDDPDQPQLPVGKQADEITAGLPFNPFAGLEPKRVDGQVMLAATLRDAASSEEAKQTIERVRAEISDVSSSALIGGVTAVQYDTNVASLRDIVVVIPLILVLITIVLILLLRSVVAPIVLMVANVLSFTATLGIAALLFNYVWDFPGADPSVVIYGFVFLIALGIDYTIFLMTRVREETFSLGVRRGTLTALVVTGGVITSAGVVLAATFAALYVIPILFLAQIAFIVAFGVLLDTLVTRSLLVPALTLEIGKKIWWPSRLAREAKK